MMEDRKEIHVLYFNTRDELLRVDLRRVAYFKADRNYTDVYFINGFHVTLPTSLMAIEQMLDDDRMKGRTIPFVRLGRSLIINISLILHINIPKQEIVLSDMKSPVVLRVPASKEALRNLKEMYNAKGRI